MQIKYTNGIGWGSNMLKSSQEKLQRQAERDSKVAFFEAQKENLKNRESLDLDDIAKKLELLHSYECFLLGKHTVERVCSGLSPLRRDRLWC